MTVDLERVREAYPDVDEPSAARLASLRASLVETLESSSSAPRRRRRRWLGPGRLPRRALILGAAALAVGAGAAFVLASLGRSARRGPAPAEARAIMRGAAAGLAVPAGAVLHVADITVQTFTNRPGWSRSREQIWLETSYPYDLRVVEQDSSSFTHPSSQEYAIVANEMQLYDPRRNTIYPKAPLPFTTRPAAQSGRYRLTPTHDPIAPTITITAAQLRALRDGQATILYDTRRHVSVVPYRSIRHQGPLANIRKTALALLHSGHAQVLDNVRFASRAAIEISGPGPFPATDRVSYYVTPHTYQPLGLVERLGGETFTTTFSTYRLLPGTLANRALVTLPGAHPHAVIDTSPAAYNAASRRLSK